MQLLLFIYLFIFTKEDLGLLQKSIFYSTELALTKLKSVKQLSSFLAKEENMQCCN